jgi:hypothetical protein
MSKGLDPVSKKPCLAIVDKQYQRPELTLVTRSTTMVAEVRSIWFWLVVCWIIGHVKQRTAYVWPYGARRRHLFPRTMRRMKHTHINFMLTYWTTLR